MTTETSTTTYTHAVWAPYVWGLGDTYKEAAENAAKRGRFNRRNDYHRVISFTRPIKSFGADFMSWSCEWADEVGEFTFIDINVKEES
ncbi:MAG: hypothetical protein ACO3O3_12890 [Ilumatobacteraceae bacterium]